MNDYKYHYLFTTFVSVQSIPSGVTESARPIDFNVSKFFI